MHSATQEVPVLSNETFLSEKLKCIAQKVSKRMTDEKLQR